MDKKRVAAVPLQLDVGGHPVLLHLLEDHFSLHSLGLKKTVAGGHLASSELSSSMRSDCICSSFVEDFPHKSQILFSDENFLYFP